MKNRGILFVISAPSGAGKTTLAEKLLASDSNLYSSVSHTTRKPRENEVDGKDYNFVDVDTFKKMIKKKSFIEWAKVFDNYYGTSYANLDIVTSMKKDLLLVIDVQGAAQLKKIKQNGCYIFILPPSMRILEERLRKRGDESENNIILRLNTALAEISEYKNYDYLIMNDDIEKASNELKSIIQAQRCRYPNFSPNIPDL